MSVFVTACRNCGTEFEPSREAIRAGTWKVCPTCQPASSTEARCRECGRPLRLTSRALCAQCMRISL
jgi:hypothetical protein